MKDGRNGAPDYSGQPSPWYDSSAALRERASGIAPLAALERSRATGG
jgi:hypothetical protein